MSDAVLQIGVGGDRGWDEARSLGARLERVPDLLADVIPPPASNRIDHIGRPATVTLTVHVTSALAAQGLPQALAGWLATRGSAVTLRISYADSQVVELQGGATVEEVARRMEPALASLGLAPQVADPDREAIAPADDDRQALVRVEAHQVGRSLRDSTDFTDADLASALVEIRLRLDRPAFFGAFRRWEESRRRVGDSVPDGESAEGAVPTLAITIYLSEEGIHGQVEAAVDELLTLAGLRIESRDEPVIGSWFRWMRAAAEEAVHSPAAREGALVAAHAVDTRLVLAQDAAVTATLLQNLGPVIASLQPTKDAVLRVGALLIVKVDWAVNVFQLTAAQQAKLDHQPQLAVSPHEIIAALDLTPAGQTDGGQLSLE